MCGEIFQAAVISGKQEEIQWKAVDGLGEEQGREALMGHRVPPDLECLYLPLKILSRLDFLSGKESDVWRKRACLIWQDIIQDICRFPAPRNPVSVSARS